MEEGRLKIEDGRLKMEEGRLKMTNGKTIFFLVPRPLSPAAGRQACPILPTPFYSRTPPPIWR
jgi:hypothetical protein